jgi:hypothetical protein
MESPPVSMCIVDFGDRFDFSQAAARFPTLAACDNAKIRHHGVGASCFSISFSHRETSATPQGIWMPIVIGIILLLLIVVLTLVQNAWPT